MDPVPSGAVELAGQLDRLAQRLRSLSDVRLARPLPPHASRAEAARALAQRLANASARLEGIAVRPVPRLHDLAVGDQVAVTGHDFVAAVRAAPAGNALVAQLVHEVGAACRELAAGL